MKIYNRKRMLIGILLLAFLARLAGLLLIEHISLLETVTLGGDALDYTKLAQNLHDYGVFSFDGETPTAFRMPGYPLLLLLTCAPSENPLVIQLLQMLAEMVTIFVVWQIGAYLSARPYIPLIAAATIAFNPLLIITSISVLPETFSIFLISLALLLLIKHRDKYWVVALAVFVLALSIYLKPSNFFLSFTLLLCYSIFEWMGNGLSRNSLLKAGFLLLIIVVVMLPWVSRNYLKMGEPITLSTNSGLNLYAGNNPDANGGYVYDGPWVKVDMGEYQSDKEFSQQARQWMRENPIEFIKLLPLKAARLFWPLSLGTSGNVDVPAFVHWPLLAGTLVFYLLVLVGTWYLFEQERFYEMVVLAHIPVVVLALTLMTFGAARFLFPAYPSIFLLVTLGFEKVIDLGDLRGKK